MQRLGQVAEGSGAHTQVGCRCRLGEVSEAVGDST